MPGLCCAQRPTELTIHTHFLSFWAPSPLHHFLLLRTILTLARLPQGGPAGAQHTLEDAGPMEGRLEQELYPFPRLSASPPSSRKEIAALNFQAASTHSVYGQ